MGGVASKEAITARLDELDKKELEVNIKLKELQMQLNDLVPDEEKIKVNEQLGVEMDPNNPDGVQEMNPMQPNKPEEENEFDEEEEYKPKKKKKKEKDDDEEEEEEDEEEEDEEEEDEDEEEEEEEEESEEEEEPKKKKKKKGKK